MAKEQLYRLQLLGPNDLQYIKREKKVVDDSRLTTHDSRLPTPENDENAKMNSSQQDRSYFD